MTATLQASLLAADLGEAGRTSGGEEIMFWIVAPLAVVMALGVIFARKAVHAALCLAGTMILLSLTYLALQAPFLAAVQVIVYTGAVMMLFLFVLMLVGVDSADALKETIKGQRGAAIVAGIGLGGLLITGIAQASGDLPAVGADAANTPDNPTALAFAVFSRYVLAFEFTSLLLITAAVGAMVLAHRERTEPKPTQRDLATERFRVGGRVTPMPSPGVFARSNAVSTPALEADGTASQMSLPKVLIADQGVADADLRRELRALEAGEAIAVLGDRDLPGMGGAYVEPDGTDVAAGSTDDEGAGR